MANGRYPDPARMRRRIASMSAVTLGRATTRCPPDRDDRRCDHVRGPLVVADPSEVLRGIGDDRARCRRRRASGRRTRTPRSASWRRSSSCSRAQQVLDRAAKEVGGGETAVSIDSAVDSAVDETANLIDVSARDGSPDTAAAIANAVASSFLDVQRELEQERLQAARESLSQEIDQLENAPDTAGEIDAIKSRVNDLRVQEASAGSDLQLAEQAIPPTEPAAPRPLRKHRARVLRLDLPRHPLQPRS